MRQRMHDNICFKIVSSLTFLNTCPRAYGRMCINEWQNMRGLTCGKFRTAHMRSGFGSGREWYAYSKFTDDAVHSLSKAACITA